MSDLKLHDVAEGVAAAVFPQGIEEAPGPQSPWSHDAEGVGSDIEKHFIGELPRHGSMLTAACLDAIQAFERFDGTTPFAGALVFRGILEVAADLHWLFVEGLDPRERARRALCIYIAQTEATLQTMRSLAKSELEVIPNLKAAIAEGEAMLASCALAAESIGHKTERVRRGAYRIGSGKPTTTSLIDGVAHATFGAGHDGIYRNLSQIAHANGAGLARLLDSTDQVRVSAGTRSRYGRGARWWSEQFLQPAAAVSGLALREFVGYAYPHRLQLLDPLGGGR